MLLEGSHLQILPWRGNDTEFGTIQICLTFSQHKERFTFLHQPQLHLAGWVLYLFIWRNQMDEELFTFRDEEKATLLLDDQDPVDKSTRCTYLRKKTMANEAKMKSME